MAPGLVLRNRFCSSSEAARTIEDQQARRASNMNSTSVHSDVENPDSPISVLPGFSNPSGTCAASCSKPDSVRHRDAEGSRQKAVQNQDEVGPGLKPRSSIPPGLAWIDPLRFGPLSQPSQEDLDKAAAFAAGICLGWLAGLFCVYTVCEPQTPCAIPFSMQLLSVLLCQSLLVPCGRAFLHLDEALALSI